MRISVFGLGYVGTVSMGCLAGGGNRVVGVDVAAKDGRLTATDNVAQAIAETDISLIAVGTPSAPDGSLDYRAIDAVTGQIAAAIKAKSEPHTVVMRSTVPP